MHLRQTPRQLLGNADEKVPPELDPPEAQDWQWQQDRDHCHALERARLERKGIGWCNVLLENMQYCKQRARRGMPALRPSVKTRLCAR